MFDPQLLAAGFIGAATADAIRWWRDRRRRKRMGRLIDDGWQIVAVKKGKRKVLK